MHFQSNIEENQFLQMVQSLEEFDSAKEVVTDLIAEYQAAERLDYVTWGGARSRDIEEKDRVGGNVEM